MDVDPGTFREGPGFVIDTRPEFEVLVRGDLVDLRTRVHPIVAEDREGVDRPYLDGMVWLSIHDARMLAVQLQEAAREAELEAD